MARRRRKKIKLDFLKSVRFWGFIFIIFSILGIGLFKPISFLGSIAFAISSFFFGNFYIIFLILLLILGSLMLWNDEVPKIFTKKLVAIYLVILVILIISHLNLLKGEEEAKLLLSNNFNDLLTAMKSAVLKSQFETIGGGLIGLLFALSFQSLVGRVFTIIFAILFIIIALVIFFEVSPKDLISKIINRKKREKTVEKEEIIEDKYQKEVVSSYEELKELAGKEEKADPRGGALELAGEKVKSGKYILPPMSILDDPIRESNGAKQQNVEKYAKILEEVLEEFGIRGTVIDYHVGPSVTQYELELEAGTKLNKLVNINKEISLALAKKDIRIQAPIPGKSTVGIEIANDKISPVSLKEVLMDEPSKARDKKLFVALGKNIMGESKFMEIDATPHLLVAGATGSGKSVCINSLIATILMRTRPDEVKLLMVDPKRVELSIYNDIPHLLSPVVTDPRKANVALQKVVVEMERRYEVFNKAKVKNIADYNKKVEKQKNKDDEFLPYIVVVVDELADLMLVASREVEDSIMRITQMARAAGIHLIIATQRPSTDVITGLVKSNIPSRISFAVSSSIDSRTILDASGAEKLLGKGDMLYFPMGASSPERIQGTFVSDEELKRLVDFVKKQQEADYQEEFTKIDEQSSSVGGDVNQEDPIYDQVLDFVIDRQEASASAIQRRFKVGYNRAANIMDLLEARGVVSPKDGSKPREVLISKDSKD